MLMRPLEDVFHIRRPRSATLGDYEEGPIPYLGNSFGSNPVAKHVTPFQDDRIFRFDAVVISAFGEATVQTQPFIAYGAGGTSLAVLEPRTPLNRAELAFYAAWLGTQMRGRFNWYYRSIPSRIKRFRVPENTPEGLHFDVHGYIPSKSELTSEKPIHLKSFPIEEIFDVRRARSSSFDDHEAGEVPFVSNGEGRGIVGYVKPLRNETVFRKPGIAISAMSGASLQAPPFIARGSGGSGLVVLQPREDMIPEQLLCVAADYNFGTKWRFNWYRQITTEHIKRLSVRLPAVNERPDKEAARSFVRSRIVYWEVLQKELQGLIGEVQPEYHCRDCKRRVSYPEVLYDEGRDAPAAPQRPSSPLAKDS